MSWCTTGWATDEVIDAVPGLRHECRYIHNAPQGSNTHPDYDDWKHCVTLFTEDRWNWIAEVVRKQNGGRRSKKFDALCVYLKEVVRCAIYVLVKDGQLKVFAPMCSRTFRYHDSHAVFGDDEWKRVEHVEGVPKEEWWLNGSMVCTKPPPDMWSDYMFMDLRNMVERGCSKLKGDEVSGVVEFVMNKRDCSLLHADPSLDPFTSRPLPPHLVDASREMPIVFSFYGGHGFRDRLMPIPADGDLDFSDVVTPSTHDRALFRGGATGLGVRKWLCESAKVLDSGVDDPMFDCRLTSIPNRIKIKRTADGKFVPVLPQRQEHYVHLMGQRISDKDWGKWRVIIYCDGNAGATRWLGMFRHGRVVIKVEDPECLSPKMWAQQFFVQGRHFVSLPPSLDHLERGVQQILYPRDEEKWKKMAKESREVAKIVCESVRDGSGMAHALLSYFSGR